MIILWTASKTDVSKNKLTTGSIFFVFQSKFTINIILRYRVKMQQSWLGNNKNSELFICILLEHKMLLHCIIFFLDFSSNFSYFFNIFFMVFNKDSKNSQTHKSNQDYLQYFFQTHILLKTYFLLHIILVFLWMNNFKTM